MPSSTANIHTTQSQEILKFCQDLRPKIQSIIVSYIKNFCLENLKDGLFNVINREPLSSNGLQPLTNLDEIKTN